MNCLLTNTKSRANVLVNTLIELGVDKIFGYPGAAVLSIYNELSKTNNICHYLVRHEQAALHAAEGYARVSGKTGVVLVTSGPGFTNTITGIANAYADSVPLVVLAGDVSTTNKSKKIFQNIDIPSMTKSCTKKTFVIDENSDIKNILEEAFFIANTGIKGPVVIALPRNILESKNANNNAAIQKNISNKVSAESIIKFNKLLSNSKKPIILLGGGCINTSEKIQKFIKSTNIPVVSTLMGIGMYPSKDNLYLGMIGINGTYAANAAINRSDLVIALGVSFSDRSTCKNSDFAKKSKIVSVNLSRISADFDLEICGDIEDFINQLLNAKVTYKTNTSWLEQIQYLKHESLTEKDTTGLHSSFVLETISEYTNNSEPIVVTDVGQHQMLTAQFFKFNKPRKFITSGGLGTMGFGLPAAIGAQIAKPNSLILNITGDGSFQMNLQELATCREHHIPIKIIILNNGYLGMVRQMQEIIYKNRYQVEMTNPDFVKIAEAYDLFAIRVNKKEELLPAIEKAINYNGTAIVDILIDQFENI